MKRKILVSCMSLTVGGGEILPMSLAAELSKTNDVYLFYHMDVEEDEGLVKRLIPQEVKILSLRRLPLLNYFAKKTNSILKLLKIKWSAYDFFRLRLLAFYVRKFDIDIVSSHSMISDEACCHVLFKKKPVVVTDHGQYALVIAEGSKSFVNYLKKATCIVVVSDFNRKLLLNEFENELPNMQIIYNGIRKPEVAGNSFRKAYSIADNTFIFGMVSRGVLEKGWRIAIESYLRLRKEGFINTTLVLVGGSLYMDELKTHYSNEQSIIFTGAFSNPSYFIKEFNTGLLPTLFPSESFPLAVIEYLFEGKPVIATNTGGIPEMLCDGETQAGQLVKRTENENLFIENIYLAMKEYLINSILYKEHSANAITLAQKFTIKECSRNYEKMFDKILNTIEN